MSEDNKPRIIFLGTPEFGALILEGLIKGGYPPFLVITLCDKPVGRKQIVTPPPVKVIAEKYNIEFWQPRKIIECREKFIELKPDLIISAAYGRLFPKEILEIPKFKSINIHPSLLPRHRGSSPIQQAILDGDKETGNTIIVMDEQFDHGPIVSRSETMKIDNLNKLELTRKLAIRGAELLVKTIPLWVEGKIKPQVQDENLATETKMFQKEDGRIDWSKSSEEIERQVRAFYPWPGSYTFWDCAKPLRVKILKARVMPDMKKENYPVGKILVVPQNSIAVKTGKDFLVIERLQLEGEKEMSSEDFLRGHMKFLEKHLK